MKIKEFHEPVKPDTYEASMALNQLLKIGNHAVKLYKLIKDEAEMEAWVQKKIDLAGDYVKKVHGYMGGEKAGLYDSKMFETYVRVKKDAEGEISQFAGRLGRVVDQDDDGDYLVSWGDNEGEDWIEKKNLEFLPDDAYWNPDDEDHYKKGSKGDQYINDPDTAGEVPMLDPEFEEDAGSLTDQQKKGLDMINKKYGNRVGGNGDSLPQGYMKARLETGVSTDGVDDEELEATLKKYGYDSMYDAEQADDDFYEKIYNKEHLPITVAMVDDLAKVMGADFDNDKKLGDAFDYLDDSDKLYKPMGEDAGEGHMSKSVLYHTAKYAIELMQMINKGDDLEGWVQSKLNKAADYLQGAYNYEEYQKLNPYREELDSNTLSKHAQVVQKHIDEILARETKLDDIDTKPGMMRILSKRVNEVEKEMAKENRKEVDEAPIEQDRDNPIAKPYVDTPEWKALHDMDDKIIDAYIKHKEVKEKAPPGREDQVKALKKKFKDKSAPYAIAWAQHNKHGKPKNEAELEEGLKDWAKSLAMAGIFVAGLAGVGSINDAINNSVPAIKAMNNALEMAKERGDDNLVAQIEKDLKGAKLRLDIGRDLNQVKYLQDKYSKFMPTEGLAYESKLAILLNQRLK